MPKAKMKQTVLGSPDGILVTKYNQGEEYLLPEKLYDSFVKNDFASPVETVEVPVVEKKEEKSIGAAPINKAMDSPVNKGEEKEDKGKK